MSLIRPLLNAYLRLIEKPRMARAKGPAQLRRAFEMQAKLLFHAPRRTQRRWMTLGNTDHQVNVLEVSPRVLTSETVILYIHGGAFVFGSPDAYAAMVAQLGYRLGARAVLPRYRLAPEAVFPAAVVDARAAWEGLLATGVRPENIVIGGDSAGGGLILGLLAELLREGAQLPGAVFCFSPLTDLTHSGDSFSTNAQKEAVLPAHRADELGQLYLDGHPPTDPRASPLFADFQGAPPIWLTVGDTEILRDDSQRLADKITAAGGDVTFVEERDLPHVWPIMHNVLPEARQTLDNLAAWIKRQPGLRGEN